MSIMSQDRMRQQMKTIGIETLTNYLQLDPFVLGNKRPITIYFLILVLLEEYLYISVECTLHSFYFIV